MLILSLTFLLSGLLIIAAALPLVYRRIPMNAFYGLRVAPTFKSDSAWFHLNEVGGMLFSMLGFPLVLAGTIGFFLPEELAIVFCTATLVVTMSSLALAIFLFMRYARHHLGIEPSSAF